MDPDLISATLASTQVLPLVQADDPDIARRTAMALIAGGLPVLEVVLRTDAAIDCLAHLVAELPDALIGAGTVITSDQAQAVIDHGATFVVSPGLAPDVVAVCQARAVPVFPGVATATELTAAYNLGLRNVKLFPAGLSGGPAMVRALASVFRDVRFVPTGGVNAQNLGAFLEIPSVLACGGSWLTPSSAIESGDFGAITELAEQAVAIAAS